jgi:S-adenosylmethionine-diacylglycerol 3-amino-3-carboxypropyl transferase
VNDTAFLSTLNYSSVNEDWLTELKALKIGPEDKILCVTGSGARPLQLLLDNPASVTAIDVNPCQVNLLRLMIIAMKELPYTQYIEFLGLISSKCRLELFDIIKEKMEPDLSDFWDKHIKMIKKGIIYQGRWERYFRLVSIFANMMRPFAIRKLFSFTDIYEQSLYVDKVWDKKWWRIVFIILWSRLYSRVFLRDPAFYRYVDPEMVIGKYIFDGQVKGFKKYLARDCTIMSLGLMGQISPHDLPPHLDLEAVKIIKPQLNKINYVIEGLTDHLFKVPSGTYSRFSLSDVPSYLSQEDFEKLFEGIIHAAKPGARFCVREFLTAHMMPERFAGMIVREPELEAHLADVDKTFAYRFITGSVLK